MNDAQCDITSAIWRKSSHSGSGDQCVEVAALPSGPRAVRDSKNADGPVLLFTPTEWRDFIVAIKTNVGYQN